MNQKIPIAGILATTVAVMADIMAFPSNGADSRHVYRSEQYHFEFSYPENFVIGKYKKEEYEVLPNAVVLVEKSLLANISATDIPVGAISTISIQPHVGRGAKYHTAFDKPKITIGKYHVAKFSRYPAPYGDEAFYYVLVKSDDMVIEFIAHKTRFNALVSDIYTRPPTHYDQIIEQIISTFVFEE